MGFLDRLLGRGSNPLDDQRYSRQVVKALHDGVAPADIEQDLIQQGVDPRRARRLVKVAVDVRDRGVQLFGDRDEGKRTLSLTLQPGTP